VLCSLPHCVCYSQKSFGIIQWFVCYISGVFTAAFDDQIEWLIVKGIADYADGAELTTENWSPFASVMAASVVKHITKDSAVFSSWPHCGGNHVLTSEYIEMLLVVICLCFVNLMSIFWGVNG